MRAHILMRHIKIALINNTNTRFIGPYKTTQRKKHGHPEKVAQMKIKTEVLKRSILRSERRK
jgi:hypothetical protein